MVDTKVTLEVRIEMGIYWSKCCFVKGRGPRIFRGRGGPLVGGPMGPLPGQIGQPFGMYFRAIVSSRFDINRWRFFRSSWSRTWSWPWTRTWPILPRSSSRKSWFTQWSMLIYLFTHAFNRFLFRITTKNNNNMEVKVMNSKSAENTF